VATDHELEARLRKLGLELAPDKTRVMPFSRYRQCETSFEFLGFEFRWGVNRKGHAWLKRRTARKRLRNSLKHLTEWCRQNRHRRIREQVQLLNVKLRGYNNYYGVNGERASLDEFFYHVRRIHQRWLNQRSQRRSYTWAAYTELMRLLRLEQPRSVPLARRSL
jgi:RNA-directed DNA polymerase